MSYKNEKEQNQCRPLCSEKQAWLTSMITEHFLNSNESMVLKALVTLSDDTGCLTIKTGELERYLKSIHPFLHMPGNWDLLWMKRLKQRGIIRKIRLGNKGTIYNLIGFKGWY